MPPDLTTKTRVHATPTPLPHGVFTLEVVDGPERGRWLRLDETWAPPILIGQGPSAALRLTDPEVSRRHLAVEPVGARLRITDLGSTNGTVVDGVAIVEAYARDGSILRMGSTLVRVHHARDETMVAPPVATAFGSLQGMSTEMRRLYPFCERLAKSEITALIEGETGTGKEALARAIHEMGPRKDGPFVVFDCTAIPASLMESELFGHERGAFSGAVARRRGVFEQAEGGTLFIDEIGDLELPLQSRLLRAIDRREVRPVGGEAMVVFNARVLAATRRNLDVEVQEGRFRDDLFHRLAVARMELPPLRRRKGDVVRLARYFCQSFGSPPETLSPEILLRWENHTWPGNVRELRNAVERHLVFGEMESVICAAEAKTEAVGNVSVASSGDVSEADDIEAILEEELPFSESRKACLKVFEKRYIERALSRYGTVTDAAKAAGIPRRYFQIVRARVKDDDG